MSALAVTLTVDELEALMERAVRKATKSPPAAEVLTGEQAAAILQVHAKTLGKYIREEGLPAKKLGQEYRILHKDLLAWMGERNAR